MLKPERIRFLPEVPVWDMAQYFQALDLYIAPQRWEGFGLTPIEAMATGCPVVATRVGAFEELITADTGSLIQPGDANAMQQAAQNLLDDPALGDMRHRARSHVETAFDLQREADAITAIYQDLLKP